MLPSKKELTALIQEAIQYTNKPFHETDQETREESYHQLISAIADWVEESDPKLVMLLRAYTDAR